MEQLPRRVLGWAGPGGWEPPAGLLSRSSGSSEGQLSPPQCCWRSSEWCRALICNLPAVSARNQRVFASSGRTQIRRPFDGKVTASLSEWGHSGILTAGPPASLKSTANPAVTVGAGSCAHTQQCVRQAGCPRPCPPA